MCDGFKNVKFEVNGYLQQGLIKSLLGFESGCPNGVKDCYYLLSAESH